MVMAISGVPAFFVGCRDSSERNAPAAKAVAETEKQVVNAQKELQEQRQDVGAAKEVLANQQAELARAETDFAAKQSRFVDSVERRLRELDAKVAGLEAEFSKSAGTLKSDMKAAVTEKMQSLKRMRDTLSATFASAKSSGETQFDALENRTSTAVKQLENAIADAEAKLRN